MIEGRDNQNEKNLIQSHTRFRESDSKPCKVLLRGGDELPAARNQVADGFGLNRDFDLIVRDLAELERRADPVVEDGVQGPGLGEMKAVLGNHLPMPGGIEPSRGEEGLCGVE